MKQNSSAYQFKGKGLDVLHSETKPTSKRELKKQTKMKGKALKVDLKIK